MVDLFIGEDATLNELEIGVAELDGTLKYSASVWNREDNRLEVGLHRKGPRVVNFANILKYETFPLARVLRIILDIAKTAMETPVEIEFAVNLNPEKNGKPTFYLLQVKHLFRDSEDCSLDLEALDRKDIFLLTQKGMGNGIVEGITDLVWVDPEKFDKSRTLEMACEVERFNERLKTEKKRYVLLGPGRWGTRDRWLGIPVSWHQISQAKVIIEHSLEGFDVDASLGSHFFHNVTSMNIGYFTVPNGLPENFIDWNWLRQQPILDRGAFLVHSRIEKPLKIAMDGKKRTSVIFKPCQ